MIDEAYFNKLRTKGLKEYATVRDFYSAAELLNALHKFQETGGRWVFRGHADSSWKLEPTLQRRITGLEDAGISLGFAGDTERYVVEEFQRRAHQYDNYLRHLPKDVHPLEWLALMQHHGAPTRLLDWTKSPYVGAFFAVADAHPSKESVMWVVDARSLKEKAIPMLKSSRPNLNDLSGNTHLGSPENFDRIFLARSSETDSVIAPVEPFTMSERLTIQQGLFLCSTTLFWPFEMTLKHTLLSGYKSIVFRPVQKQCKSGVELTRQNPCKMGLGVTTRQWTIV